MYVEIVARFYAMLLFTVLEEQVYLMKSDVMALL